jgi:phage terminase large subunit GpA-like protein
MIPVMRACVDPRVKRVTVVCGAQMGKTDSILNVIGARLDDNPAPVLYVGPTRSQVEKIIEPRLMAMIRSSKNLRAIYAKGKASSKTAKRINGVLCRLAWAGSPSELASQEAAIAAMDEIDRMAFDLRGEGSPIELVDARLATFPGSKLILTSTPTEGSINEYRDERSGLVHWELSAPEDVRSTVWRSWQEGTRHEWAWPCPDCSRYFIPRFNLLKWPEKSTPGQAFRKARLACPACGVLIEDRFKAAMNRRGVFAAPGQSIDDEGNLSGDFEFNSHASFWISGLCSPWLSWGKRAGDFVTAVRSGDTGRIQAVTNTGFGELWKSSGESLPWQDIRALGAGYSHTEFPAGPIILTCGVDVQQDRLIYVIRGWSYNLESWLVEHGELYGETVYDPVWGLLGNLLNRTWGDLSIRLMVVDSGYAPRAGHTTSEVVLQNTWRRPDHMVYKFCRQYSGRAVPTKGHDEQSKPLHSAEIDILINGQTIKKGLRLWHIDSNFFKSWVYARLKQPVDSNNAWHLPHDVSEDYCMQITAEAKLVKASGRISWIRLRKENHVLDCEVLNVAAAHMLSLQTLRPRGEEPTAASKDPSPGAVSPPAIVTPRPTQPSVAQGVRAPQKNWINGWR